MSMITMVTAESAGGDWCAVAGLIVWQIDRPCIRTRPTELRPPVLYWRIYVASVAQSSRQQFAEMKYVQA